jgi:C-terminal processing protease CtpA/Prc
LRSAAALFLAFALSAQAAGAQGSSESERIERLAALGKLWASAKYFHPFLAYRDIDWDGALVAALPRAAAARNAAEYAAAVQSMLSPLGDPATRVVRPSAAPKGTPRRTSPLTRETDDGILVVTINPETAASQSRLREAAAEIGRAKGVVFDLRFEEQWSGQDSNTVALMFSASGLNKALAFGSLKTPGQRSRMHSGLASPYNGGGVYFHSAFYVRDGAAIEAGAGAPRKPVVFLIDPTSGLPPIAAALQAAGSARIVAEGGGNDASLVDTHRVDLPHGVEVQLRFTELVFEDGTTGLSPDLVVPPGGDRALKAALDLARLPGKASAPARRRLPPYGVLRREEAHAIPDYPKWEHRMMAAFRVWAAFEYFFAYRDLMGEDWDAVLKESLPKLEQAADAREYALAIAGMVTHVHDSHAKISGSRAFDDFLGVAPPPIQTRMIEGLPVVTALLDEDAAAKAGIAPGDIILAVDGEDARERMRRLGRYIAASTPQSLDRIVMQYWLNGSPGTVAALTVRDGNDKVKEVRIARSLDALGRYSRTCEVLQILPGNIGYADLERLAPSGVDEMFEKFKDTKAIIFDMRGYPRGTAWLIAPRLTERKGVVAARFRRPLALAPEGRWGDVSTLGAGWDFVQYIPEVENWKYRGQTVMLIDERAMSQAEHAGLFFEAANGTRFIGSRTAGANGDVTRFTIPGGITVRFSGHDIRHADGRQLQRVGLIPDVEVKPSIQGVRAGRDEVLEKALEHLGVRGARLSRVGEAR